MTSLLEIDDLSVDYRVDDVWQPVIQNIDLSIERGEVLGVVGESGCGKTTLARTILRLLPKNGRVRNGRVTFDGDEILGMTDKQFRTLRWSRMSMVFQGAMNVLDPVYMVGAQIGEAIRTHRTEVGRRAAWRSAETLLRDVGIEPERARSYPHELSGGQKQRVVIAMALALEPDLVVADEPTTALDVVTQDNVLEQLTRLQEARGFSLVLVSHDMGVIAETCDRVAVMYAGQIVEVGTVGEIFKRPTHPYTIGLINAIPRIGKSTTSISIPGNPPRYPGLLTGCRFETRCPFREPICSEPVPITQVSTGHLTRCLFPERHSEFRSRASDPDEWDRVAERLATEQ